MIFQVESKIINCFIKFISVKSWARRLALQLSFLCVSILICEIQKYNFVSQSLALCNGVAHVKKVMDKNPSRQISSAVENMLKTGRLPTQSGLDLQQVLEYFYFIMFDFKAECHTFPHCRIIL